MQQIKADGSSGPVDMGTLLNQQSEVQHAGDVATRIGQLITPNAQSIHIQDLHNYPDRIEITEFCAEFADGTVVTAPAIVIKPNS